MTVHVKVFPIAGLCDETQKLELALEEGNMDELLMQLQECLKTDQLKTEALMFMHNGRTLNRSKDVAFRDGDEVWLMPLLSGG